MNATMVVFLIVCLFVIFTFFRNRSTMRKVAALIKNGALGVDVRSGQEYRDGHFGAAINVPYEECERRIAEFGTDKTRPIILYCHAGSRSAVAHGVLKKLGFGKVINARSYAAMQRFERNAARS